MLDTQDFTVDHANRIAAWASVTSYSTFHLRKIMNLKFISNNTGIVQWTPFFWTNQH